MRLTKRFRVLGILAVVLAAGFAKGDSARPTFDVKQYGATGDGQTMDTVALQKTIDAAASAGGGTVLLTAGKYLSGSIDLKSHVTLRVETNATLLGSPHQRDYRGLNFRGLILADKQEDFAICGNGTIDGQGTAVAGDTFQRHDKGELPDAAEGQRPVLIDFRDCKHLAVRDVTLKDSGCWVEEYYKCKHVEIENVTVRSIAAPNNDGIDIDGCSHVVVRGCDIDSEDDGICLKSGKSVCEDVLVENCRLRSSCNGLKLGTGSAIGFKNIICRHLTIYDTYISAIALEIVDGGEMNNVQISDIQITNCNNPIFVRLGHRNKTGAVGSLHGVTISNVTALIPNRPQSDFTKFPVFEGEWRHKGRPTLLTAALIGLPGHPVQDVTLADIDITYGGMGNTARPGEPRLDSLSKVPESTSTYPEISKFGTLPAWGFYCRHAEGIRFTNVTLRVQGSDYRSAVICDDARDIVLDGLHVLSAGSEPVIVLNNVRETSIHNCPAPAGATRFIQTMGNTTAVTAP